MKNIRIRIALLLSVLSGLLFVSPLALAAVDCNASGLTAQQQVQCGITGATPGGGNNATPEKSLGDTIKTAINLLSAAVGVAAVIMIIIGGFRYITSGGSSDKITSAKNTLVYAVIGLVIVALAQTIVHFALTEANNPSTGSKASDSSSSTSGSGGLTGQSTNNTSGGLTGQSVNTGTGGLRGSNQ